MSRVRALKIVALVFSLVGVIFSGVGLGIYFGFAFPETRNMRIAQNADLPTQNAVFTQVIPTNFVVGNQRMYRLRFGWDGQSAQTNPIYTYNQANDRVGQTVLIRVDDNGRAVPVDFFRSGHSTLGFIFLGVFGGIGLIMVIGAMIASRMSSRTEEEGA